MTASSNLPINRKIALHEYIDEGEPKPEDFYAKEETARAPEDGEIMVAVDSLSIDAFIRTTLNSWEGHHEQTPLGAPIAALGVGRVLESRAEGFAEGDAVFGPFKSQTVATLTTESVKKVDDSLPLKTHLGVLGLTTGLTAYVGMQFVGAPKPGDVVMVSGAAGAVGSIAAQIAKIVGAKVIGVAGGAEKCAFLTQELGLDGAIDYKAGDVDAQLKALAPDGIDVFFDNVGGEILDVALDNMKMRARIVICGAISQYSDHLNVKGPSLYLRLAERQSRMEGFVVTHFAERFGEAEADLTKWFKSGELKMAEHVKEGIDGFPDALCTLFNGGHIGKMMVKI